MFYYRRTSVGFSSQHGVGLSVRSARTRCEYHSGSNESDAAKEDHGERELSEPAPIPGIFRIWPSVWGSGDAAKAR